MFSLPQHHWELPLPLQSCRGFQCQFSTFLPLVPIPDSNQYLPYTSCFSFPRSNCPSLHPNSLIGFPVCMFVLGCWASDQGPDACQASTVLLGYNPCLAYTLEAWRALGRTALDSLCLACLVQPLFPLRSAPPSLTLQGLSHPQPFSCHSFPLCSVDSK